MAQDIVDKAFKKTGKRVYEWEDITSSLVRSLFKKYTPGITVEDIEFNDEEHEIYVTIETYDMRGIIDKEQRISLEKGYNKIVKVLNAAGWDYLFSDIKRIKIMFKRI